MSAAPPGAPWLRRGGRWERTHPHTSTLRLAVPEGEELAPADIAGRRGQPAARDALTVQRLVSDHAVLADEWVGELVVKVAPLVGELQRTVCQHTHRSSAALAAARVLASDGTLRSLKLPRYGGHLQTWGRRPRGGVRMSQPRPPYPPEVRAEAIRRARTSGRPHAEIARQVGMTGETRRLWLKQADVDEGQRSDGVTTDEQEERRRRRREHRSLREERARHA